MGVEPQRSLPIWGVLLEADVMLDLDANVQFVDAAATLMRTCAVVTAQTVSSSACRGLNLWSQWLRSLPARPATLGAAANPFASFWRVAGSDGWMANAASSPMGAWARGSRSTWNAYAGLWDASANAARSPYSDWTGWNAWPQWAGISAVATPSAALPAEARAASRSGYASYRSSGGHAVAQVIVPESGVGIAGLSTSAGYVQVPTMLGAWLALLRA
jgi:hypothetical protein